MFERYTEKARRTIFFGRYEASQFGSAYIESEHLLLGLLREDKALSNTFLHAHDAVESIRKRLEGQPKKISASIDLPLSNECVRILAFAAEEADTHSHKFIGTGHLFLALLRERECVAAKLLRERGIVLESAREKIGSMPSEPIGPARKSSGIPAGYAAHRLLYNNASETIIVELRSSSRSLLPTRILVRHKDKEGYEPVGSPAEEVSYESAVTCQSLPLAMFNSLRWDKTGADWQGMYCYNLTSNELKLCISPQDLRFAGAQGQPSITDLVSLSEDAQTVCARIAVETIVSRGAISHYYLAKIDMRDRQVSLLSPLLDIYF